MDVKAEDFSYSKLAAIYGRLDPASSIRVLQDGLDRYARERGFGPDVDVMTVYVEEETRHARGTHCMLTQSQLCARSTTTDAGWSSGWTDPDAAAHVYEDALYAMSPVLFAWADIATPGSRIKVYGLDRAFHEAGLDLETGPCFRYDKKEHIISHGTATDASLVLESQPLSPLMFELVTMSPCMTMSGKQTMADLRVKDLELMDAFKWMGSQTEHDIRQSEKIRDLLAKIPDEAPGSADPEGQKQYDD